MKFILRKFLQQKPQMFRTFLYELISKLIGIIFYTNWNIKIQISKKIHSDLIEQ